MYYATPPHPFALDAAPEQTAFPSLAVPGAAEKGASCADLDVELVRAEDIRWYARNRGGIPFTSGEAAAKHTKNSAKNTGIAVLVFLVMAGGGGGGCFSNCGAASVNVLSPEDWRWVVTDADRRVVGLLDLKQARGCAARAVAGMEGGDLGVLESIRSAQRDRAAGLVDDKAQLAQQTAWLDELGPKPVMFVGPSPMMLGAGASAAADPPGTFSQASWVPNKSSFSILGTMHPWRGTVVLSEKSLTLLRLPIKGEQSAPDVNMPYADMASVEVKSMIKARWIVITHLDGHVDSFWLSNANVIDGERTEAAGALLKSMVPAKGLKSARGT